MVQSAVRRFNSLSVQVAFLFDAGITRLGTAAAGRLRALWDFAVTGFSQKQRDWGIPHLKQVHSEINSLPLQTLQIMRIFPSVGQTL